ncbi:ABC transporter substrate-binding protein [Cohnella faecalis]|uniref:Extracellular solute-binding protein n=1 Tax=Cohnella faecalis TaxID=2315694 RepID=A0A398CYD7_9BACL|nr:extracellular solute-binding protein [Cohnella faecalis]RIE04241.1 extracellular solute-binding protein [Cohnella faecalis]
MTRRKFALLFLLLGFMTLVLAPWATAPSAIVLPRTEPDNGTVVSAAPNLNNDPVRIRVSVGLDEQEFDQLQEQNAGWSTRHPDIQVELSRVEPEDAYRAFKESSRLGEAADVMLLQNEWVREYAASGYLLTADAAFVGEALAEQFDALTASLKWNGYIWGVPRDFDPYVLVWNREALRKVLGDEATVPLTLQQWTALTAKASESGEGISWLAISNRDPFAILSWLESATGIRTDSVWENKNGPWSSEPWATALSLLNHAKEGIAFGQDASFVERQLLEEKALIGLLPNSEAVKLTERDLTSRSSGVKLIVDRSRWKLPFVWPRGRSYVVSSGTEAEDAARQWIVGMTGTENQLLNEKQFAKLPVYRSLFRTGTSLHGLLPEDSANSFPYQAPVMNGPELPERLDRLSELWYGFAASGLTADEWISRWSEESADFQLND